MYKKKKLARKKHRKNKLRLKAKIQESLLKAKPKTKKIVEQPQVESTQVEAPIKETVAEKAPAKKKAAAKKAAPRRKAAAKRKR